MKVKFSYIAALMLSVTPGVLLASQGIDVGDGWMVSGDIRAGYVKYDYSSGNVSEGFYTTGKLSLITPTLAGFSAKATAAGATDFGLNDENKQFANYVLNAADPVSYAILQEAYLKYEDNGNEILVGRDEFSTPMVSSGDYYFLTDTYEVAYYRNTMLDTIVFTTGYFNKMASVWNSGAYDPVVAPLGGTAFYSMSQSSFVSQTDKDNAGDKGIAFVGLDYSDNTNKVQLWDYYVFELYNILFAQYDYTNTAGALSYDIGLQYINFKETGALASNNITTIDYSIMSAKFAGGLSSGFDFNLGVMEFTDGEGTGSTLAAFAGYPYFAFGNIVHWFNVGSYQNATNYQAAAGYDLGKAGLLDGLRVDLKYVYTDVDPRYSKSKSTGESQEYQKTYDVGVSYVSVSGAYLNLSYQYADIDKEEAINGYRLIGGYKF